MAQLTDMEELLATIPATLIRDYMREAMRCYMAGAYRGCITLSYIALFDDLLNKLGELANVNTAAKTIFVEATKRKADQDVFESYLIDQLSSKTLLSGLDATFLTTLRVLRNKSAHPSGHNPSPEEARFIFFETVSRFLSQPILSTTQLVDDLIGRLKNSNFFPTSNIDDIKRIVDEEISRLHDEALPQLVAKLAAEVATTADMKVKQNAEYFLIGLAKQSKELACISIRAKIITSKCDDPNFADLILQLLSANGKLFHGVTPVHSDRIRSLIAKKIGEITGALNESHLNHPTSTLSSIATELSEPIFVKTFKPELESLFKYRGHSEFVVRLVASKPSLVDMYFPALLQQAGASDFGTANAFANALAAVESPLSALLSDEQSFQLFVAVIRAAEWGAWGAKGVANSKFSEAPALRFKALQYIQDNPAAAEAYVGAKLVWLKPIADFVASHLAPA